MKFRAREAELAEINQFWKKALNKLRITKPEEFLKLSRIQDRHVQKTIDGFLTSKYQQFYIEMKKYLNHIKVRL